MEGATQARVRIGVIGPSGQEGARRLLQFRPLRLGLERLPEIEVRLRRLEAPHEAGVQTDHIQLAVLDGKSGQAFAETAIPQAQSAADTMLQTARGASESEVATARGAAEAAGDPMLIASAARAAAMAAAATGRILAAESDFSVGCYCEDETRCHRSVLRELLIERGARIAR